MCGGIFEHLSRFRNFRTRHQPALGLTQEDSRFFDGRPHLADMIAPDLNRSDSSDLQRALRFVI